MKELNILVKCCSECPYVRYNETSSNIRALCGKSTKFLEISEVARGSIPCWCKLEDKKNV